MRGSALLLALVLLGVGARADAAVVGQEFVLDPTMVYPFNGMDGGADAVYDGSAYFVVWSAFGRLPGEGRAAYGILGLRSANDGTFLGSNYFAASATSPTVAFDGTSYLLVFEDRSSDLQGDIVATRLRPTDLLPLDSGGTGTSIVLQRDCQIRQGSPRAAFDAMSGNYLVVWQDDRAGAGADVYGARIRAMDGTALDPPGGVLIAGDPGVQAWPRVAPVLSAPPMGGEPAFEVAWLSTAPSASSARVTTARVGALTGTVSAAVEASSLASADPGVAPALVPGFGGHVVLWTDLRAGNRDLYGARLDAQGVPSGAEVALAVGPEDEGDPRAVWNGNEVVVAYGRTEAGLRRSRGLVLVQPNNGALAGTAFDLPALEAADTPVAIAFGGADYAVYRQTGQDVTGLLLRARVAADFRVEIAGDPVMPANANAQQEPAAAFGAGRFLALFTDDGADHARRGITARLVSQGGEVLPPAPLHLGTARGDAMHPAVAAASDRGFLVAWADRRNEPEVSQCAPPAVTQGFDLYATRVGPDGRVLGTELEIARFPGNQSRPAIASDGQGYLVIWEDGRGGLFTELYGVRIDMETGATLGQQFVVSGGTAEHTQPALAWNGSSYLVVWNDARNRSSSGTDIYGIRLDAGGGRLGSEMPIVTQPGDQRDPAVASDGAGFFVAWTSPRPSSDDADVYGVRMDGAGASQGMPLVIAADPMLVEQAPQVAFDGTHYVVAWLAVLGSQSTLVGRRITTGGALVDPQAITLSSVTAAVEWASIASDRLGHTLLPFTGVDRAPMVQSARARAVLLASLPMGAACTLAEQCAMGQCTGLVCGEGGGGGGAGAAGGSGVNAALPNAHYRPGCAIGRAAGAALGPCPLVFAAAFCWRRRRRRRAAIHRRIHSP